MRRRTGLVPGLLLVCLAGCAHEQSVRRPNFLDQAAQTVLAPDGVIIDVVVIERPLRDSAYLNQELWDCTDEQVVSLEHKAVLEDNGFRVGHVVGMTPGRLQNLLTSQRWCASHWRQILSAGKSATFTVGRTVPEFRYRLVEDGRPADVALEKAQAFLVVVPTLTADGRTRLKFTPQIQYGDPLRDWRPDPERQDWEVSCRRRSLTYPDLGWEVTLAPNEYLVIGAVFDNPQSLGYQCFVQEQDQAPVQRLLAIRTTRSTAEAPADPAELPESSTADTHLPPPPALQAMWGTAGRR
jgi:hypothetical protein